MASKTSNDTTNEKNENQTFISKLPNKRLFKDIINISKNPPMTKEYFIFMIQTILNEVML